MSILENNLRKPPAAISCHENRQSIRYIEQHYAFHHEMVKQKDPYKVGRRSAFDDVERANFVDQAVKRAREKYHL